MRNIYSVESISLRQRFGHTNSTMSTRLKMGPSENMENLPICCVVTTASGIPTVISKNPADSPRTRIHSLGRSTIPTVTTAHPIKAIQCRRCTMTKRWKN